MPLDRLEQFLNRVNDVMEQEIALLKQEIATSEQRDTIDYIDRLCRHRRKCNCPYCGILIDFFLDDTNRFNLSPKVLRKDKITRQAIRQAIDTWPF